MLLIIDNIKNNFDIKLGMARTKHMIKTKLNNIDSYYYWRNNSFKDEYRDDLLDDLLDNFYVFDNTDTICSSNNIDIYTIIKSYFVVNNYGIHRDIVYNIMQYYLLPRILLKMMSNKNGRIFLADLMKNRINSFHIYDSIINDTSKYGKEEWIIDIKYNIFGIQSFLLVRYYHKSYFNNMIWELDLDNKIIASSFSTNYKEELYSNIKNNIYEKYITNVNIKSFHNCHIQNISKIDINATILNKLLYYFSLPQDYEYIQDIDISNNELTRLDVCSECGHVCFNCSFSSRFDACNECGYYLDDDGHIRYT